jgi:hypothetical protein
MPDHTEAVIVDVPSDPSPAITTPSKYDTSKGPSTLEVYQQLWKREAETPQVAPAAGIAFSAELPGLTREELESNEDAARIAVIKHEMAIAQAQHQQRMQGERAETRQAKIDAVVNAISASENRVEEATNRRDYALAIGDHQNASYWSGEVARRSAQLDDLNGTYQWIDEYETARQNAPRQQTFAEVVNNYAVGPKEQNWAYQNVGLLQSPGGVERLQGAIMNAQCRGLVRGSPALVNDVNLQIHGRPAYQAPSAPAPQRVTLSREQQDLARQMGLTNKQYAQELLKLNELKRQGRYGDGQ